jgi:hypothetical protein
MTVVCPDEQNFQGKTPPVQRYLVGLVRVTSGCPNGKTIEKSWAAFMDGYGNVSTYPPMGALGGGFLGNPNVPTEGPGGAPISFGD